MTTKAKHTYTEAVGRRKTSTSRVRIEDGKYSISINGKDLATYFPTKELQHVIESVFIEAKLDKKGKITVMVKGGGIHSQAEAVRHGLARLLVKTDETLKKIVKKAGMLKRDPRAKERRKFGLKKARKSPQWSKR